MAAGNATIGALKVSLGLDSAQFEAGLKKAQGGLAGFGKSAAIAGAAIGTALVAAGIAVGAALKGAIDNADELSKTAQKTGVAVDALSALKYAGDLADVSLDQLSTGLKKLGVNMAEAGGKGTGKAADAFKALGISVTDAAGNLRASDAVFADVAESFAHMQDGAGKTALAVALFGKAGADLIPLLNEGKAGLAEMRAEAERLGVVIDQQTASAAENFNDNLTRLKTVIGGVSTQLAVGMLPALESVSAALVTASQNSVAMDAVAKLLGGTIRVLATAVVGVAGAFAYLGTIAKGVFTFLNAPIGKAGEALKALDGVGARATATAKATGQAIRDIWSEANLAPLRKAQAEASGDGGIAAPLVRGATKAAKAAKEIKVATDHAAKATADYIQRLEQEIAETGQTEAAVRKLSAAREIEAALKRGDVDSAVRIHDLVLEREAVEDLTASLKEAAESLKKLDGTFVDFENTPATLARDIDKMRNPVRDLVGDANDLADAFDDVAFSFGGIGSAFKTGNFSRLIQDVFTLKDGITALLSQGLQGTLTLGSAVANAIGGKGGRAIGGGLGIAAGGVGLGAFAATGAGAAALGTIGLGAGAIAGIAALAGPIGLAVGALYAAAKIFNIGGKPSNRGAGFDLRTGAISGNKRSDETEQAARAAGEAIIGIQDALKAAGIGLKDAVTGLVIGTRDQTQIYLESGKTLLSAKGDAGAAVDAAFRELLAGATYTSEAQKKLVESMLAAGKSFETITAALDAFAAAQNISSDIADEILRLTDPKAFDVDTLQESQAARRASLKAMVDEGYLTAEQLASINVQLAKLENLELDDVLSRYADATDAATQVQQEWADRIATSADAVDSARDDYRDALESDISAAEDLRDRFLAVADSLAGFRRELNETSLGGLNPRQQLLAAQKAFDSLKGKTDEASLAQLPEVGRALIEAQRAVAPNASALAATTAEVRAAVIAGEASARGQAAQAQAEAQALKDVGVALGVLNDTILTSAEAEQLYGDAIVAHSIVIQQAAAAIVQAVAAAGQSMTQAANTAALAANENATAAASMAPAADTLSKLDVKTTGSGPLTADQIAPYLLAQVKNLSVIKDWAQLQLDEAV